MKRTWKQYEQEICNIFKSHYPDAQISANVFREGRYSKANRQIDILIEGRVAGSIINIVIDGKYYNKKIDVKEVESFIGMLQDLGVHKGILISQKGFSQAAINRAYNDPLDLEVDILNFEDLKQFQSFCAIPYAGECGVLLGPPFGWVVDAGICQEMPALAALYQRGCTFQEANQASEFMYINFWDRKKENDNLDSYIQKDDRRLSEHYKKACEYIDTITRPDKQQTKLRKINIQKNLVEYTGFVEFEEFIFFCVLITPTLLEKRNVRKLEYIIESVIPIKLTHQNLNTMKEPFDAKAPATT